MVGAKKPHDRLALDDELYGWPSAVRDQGAWVRKTEDAPAKRLPSVLQKEEEKANTPQDDDWFLGAYRRYHAGQKEEKPQRTASNRKVAQEREDKPEVRVREKTARSRDDRLADELEAQLAKMEEVPYEERPTVAMFVQRNRPATPSIPQPPTESASRTRHELYREAQRRGIEGRSKMNKRQLAEALDDRESKSSQQR